jgi:hypothetical protein
VTSGLHSITKEHVTRPEEIPDFLRDMGIGYVVIEEKTVPFWSRPFRWLRDELQSDRFILRQRIPLRSNTKRLAEVASLEVYEVRAYTPVAPGKTMDFTIPLMRGAFSVRLDELVANRDHSHPSALREKPRAE